MKLLLGVLMFAGGCHAGPLLLPGADECQNACAVLRAYECPEGLPNARGEACEQVCGRVQATGYLRLDTGCVVRAQTVSEIRLCNVRCER